MSEAVYEKQEIACEYIELAMRLFMEGRDYFCVIHLASAAAELLDQHLPEEIRSFNRAWKGQRALQAIESGVYPETEFEYKKADREAKRVVNQSKNAVKHMSDGEPSVLIDPPCEAEWWLESALNSYYKLGLKRTTTLQRFEAYQSESARSEFGAQI